VHVTNRIRSCSSEVPSSTNWLPRTRQRRVRYACRPVVLCSSSPFGCPMLRFGPVQAPATVAEEELAFQHQTDLRASPTCEPAEYLGRCSAGSIMLLVGERGTCKAAGCVKHVTEGHHFTADVEVREMCRIGVLLNCFLAASVCCPTLRSVVRETNSVKVVLGYIFSFVHSSTIATRGWQPPRCLNWKFG